MLLNYLDQRLEHFVVVILRPVIPDIPFGMPRLVAVQTDNLGLPVSISRDSWGSGQYRPKVIY